MKKTLFNALALVLLVGAAVLFPLTAAHAIETFQMETELRIYNPAKSYGGYFMPSNYDLSGFFGGTPTGNTSYLMDMEGYWSKSGITSSDGRPGSRRTAPSGAAVISMTGTAI